VNATRVPKKARPSKSSPEVVSLPQKVEGLRNRVKKSSIELAVELRAKRDTPVRQLFFVCLFFFVRLTVLNVRNWQFNPHQECHRVTT